jgi:hypothetical protein
MFQHDLQSRELAWMPWPAFAPTLVLRGGGYLKSFSPDQLNTLALLSLNLFGLGAVIFAGFYGMGWVLRGYLIFQSGYIPVVLRASIH